MDAIRTRSAPAIEWCVAAAFLLATLTVGSLIVRELRTVRTLSAAAEVEAGPAPSRIPAGAVSVPALLLLDGKQIQVGQMAGDAARLLTGAREVEPALRDRGALGDRVTRFYEYGGTAFILVLEPFERGGALRVAEIYLR
jgi:hypothetical protein